MNGETDEFTEQLSVAARAMQAEDGTQQTLERAILNVTEMIEACDLAGISILRKDGIETPAASDELTRRIDQLQYELRQGPCYDALREHEIVRADDLLRDERWPQWGHAMAEQLGVRSSLSYRLFITDDSLGSMDLYSRTANAFDDDDLLHGRALAAHIAVAVAAAQDSDNLRRAVTNRTVIGQAEGILMERFGITADRAFDVLRRVSQHRNQKLNRVAEQLVSTRETPS